MSDLNTRPPINAVRDAVRRALAEDLMPIGDLTSALLPADSVATADFVVRVAGVLAGTDCATEAFAQIDPDVHVEWFAADGEAVDAKQVIGRVHGPLTSMLTAERTALNFLCHLSGIASATRRYADLAKPARIWDTRKTIPGLRTLEKAAVRAGGGANHRGNLSDWVLLKDNHLALLGIEEAVRRARETWPARTVHVECERLDQVEAAVAADADAILLDNMTPEEVRACVKAADAHAATSSRRRPLLEVSGGINLDTVADYADTGADCISVGALTMSSPSLDIGLDIKVDR